MKQVSPITSCAKKRILNSSLPLHELMSSPYRTRVRDKSREIGTPAIEGKRLQGLNQSAEDKLTISPEARAAYEGSQPKGEGTPNGDADRTRLWLADPTKQEDLVLTIDSDFFGLYPEDWLLMRILEDALGIKVRVSRDHGHSQGEEMSADGADRKSAVGSATKPRDEPQAGTVLGISRTIESMQQAHKDDGTLSLLFRAIIKTKDGKRVSIPVHTKVPKDLLSHPKIAALVAKARSSKPIESEYSGSASSITRTSFTCRLAAGFDRSHIRVTQLS